jgi:sugar transferase (PEP-CTERM/EpsH1 system associated)
MKILHVVPSFGFGGMEKIICSVINRTSSHYRHIVLVLNDDRRAEKWIQEHDVGIISLERPDRRITFFKAIYKVLSRIAPNMLMTYNWGATDAIWIGKIAGIENIIHNEHGFSSDEAYSTNWKRDIVRSILYRLASHMIVVSHDLVEKLEGKFYIKKDSISFIPNGIDTDYYSPNDSERCRIRKELNFTDSDFIVGFVGRLDPVKNFELMIRVIDHCIKQCDRFKLLIVGSGPEKAKIQSEVLKRNIQTHIRLVEEQEDVRSYLRALDVFLLTSISEQMPLAVMESMSVGVPVIAPRIGEIPRIIVNKKYGFLIERSDGEEIFTSVLQNLSSSGSITQMKSVVRERIRDDFDVDIMVHKYMAVIDKTLACSS